MKKNFFLLSLLHSVWGSIVNAQLVVSGGCTSVTPVSGIQTYESDLWVGPYVPHDSKCEVTFGATRTRLKAMFTLQRFNQSTNTWTNAVGPQLSSTFNNVSHGTYRISAAYPARFVNDQCPSGYDAYIFNGQRIGRLGTTFGPTDISNTVIVGKTVSSDISTFFVDGGNGNILPNGFDFGEIATLNISGCKNYDLYWLAIFEDTAPNRYWSQGWTSGTGGNTFNLSEKWGSPSNWALGTPGSLSQYKIQFAIENSQCINSSWNVTEPVFIICPQGTGCRYVDTEAKKMDISPNPASGSCQINNFDPSQYTSHQLSITDMAGQQLKGIHLSSSEVDISDLPNGMYIVTLWNNSTRVFSEKLIINQ